MTSFRPWARLPNARLSRTNRQDYQLVMHLYALRTIGESSCVARISAPAVDQNPCIIAGLYDLLVWASKQKFPPASETYAGDVVLVEVRLPEPSKSSMFIRHENVMTNI